MGAFFESILAKTNSVNNVRAILERLVKETGASFYLGPAIEGWVSIFPESGANGGSIALRIAEATQCDLFYLTVHDDDFLTYDFFREGKLLDRYNSCPDYFGEEAEGYKDEEGDLAGHPELFRDLLPNPSDFERLKSLLGAEHEKYAFESARLEEFAGLLGLKNAAGSFDYIEAGEREMLEEADRFVHLKGAGLKVEAAPAQLCFDAGRVFRSEGKLTHALALFDQAIQTDPNLALAYNSRGLTKMELGDMAGARADFDRAIELQPDLVVAYANRGELKRKQQDGEGALADFNRALEIDPAHGHAYHNRAEVKKAKGDIQGALADFDQAVELMPESGTARNNRAEAKRLSGDLAGALADFDRAIELLPTNPSFFNNRALARQGSGDLDGALADFNRALEIKPQGTFYNNRALLMHAKGDLAAACADLDKAIELKPDTPDYYQNRGQIRLVQGDLDGGLADARKAVELRPKSPDAHNLLGEAHRRRKEWESALENFNKAIEVKPTFGPAYNGRGLVKRAKDDLNGALADLEEAVRLLPKAPLPYNNRGVVLQAMGELERAEADFRKALELKPGMVEAEKNLQAVMEARAIKLVVSETAKEEEAGGNGGEEGENAEAGAPMIRTAFSDEKRWKSLCTAARKADNDFGFSANVEFNSDKQYEGWTPEQLMKIYEGKAEMSFLLVADATAINTKGYPILVVDLSETPGRTFRVMAKELWEVENNLSTGNMGFGEFADQVGPDGIFCGFLE